MDIYNLCHHLTILQGVWTFFFMNNGMKNKHNREKPCRQTDEQNNKNGLSNLSQIFDI